MAICNRDCFNCIYDDCIDGRKTVPKKKESKKVDKSSYRKGYYARHREELKEYSRQYYKDHKDHVLDLTKNWKAKQRKAYQSKGENMMDFGKWLSDVRKEMMLSQSEFGTLFFMDCQTISEYECGKRNPTYKTLARMTDILGYDVVMVKRAE